MPLAPPDYRKTRYTHRRDTRANQPAATDVLSGTLYYVTDEGVLERSNGAIWQSYSASGVPSFTQGSVIFEGAAGLAEDNTNFFWDDTNNILRVPTLAGGTGTTSDLRLRATTGAGTTGSWIFFEVGNNGAITAMDIDDVGRIGMGTTGIIGLQSKLTIRQANPPDIGYVVVVTSNLSAYVLVQTGSGANEVAGFVFSQNNNSVDWRMAVIGNDANAMRWSTNISGSAVNRFYVTVNGNFILDTARNEPTTGTKCFIFGDGTAPATMASNTAGIYANDVGGTVQLFAINEADESTRLTWPAPQTYTITNVTPDRAYDATATTLAEIANVLGTLIDDLRNRGVVA